MSGFNGGAIAPIQVANNLTTTGIGYALDARQGAELKVLRVSKNSVSSLPTTITDSRITADMYCLHSELSNSGAQIGDWTVTPSSGSLTISGTISGTTHITLYLAHGKESGASSLIKKDLIPLLPANPSTYNDANLYGARLNKGSDVPGLPTSDSKYYRIICLRTVQIAFHWVGGNDGCYNEVYAREYVNSQWYSWTLLSGLPVKQAITGADSDLTTEGYFIYTPSTHTVRVYLYAYSDVTFTTSKILGNIPSGYRPTSDQTLLGFFRMESGTVMACEGKVYTNGNINQTMSSYARAVFLTGEYII